MGRRIETVPSSRIFVSYACIGDEQGSTIGKQLVRDIQATGAETVADHEAISNEQFMSFLNRELPQCTYLIFVQTPVALRSLRVQTAVTMATTLVERQQMRGTMRIIAAPIQGMDSQPLLTRMRTFDASADYARARDQLFLELGLISLDTEDSSLTPFSLLIPPPPSSAGSNLSTRPSGPMSMPSGSMSRPSGPMPSGPISQPYNPSVAQFRQSAFTAPVPPLKNALLKAQTILARTLQTVQTRIASRSARLSVEDEQTMVEDRPLPLHTTRKTIIRWASVIGIFLLLVLVIILLIHSHTDVNHTPAPVKHPSPTPTPHSHRPSPTPTPRSHHPSPTPTPHH
jgi:hypothetical protein